MITYHDFLSSAKTLIDYNAPEVTLRNSISRAYYANFHAVTYLAQQLKLESGYSTSHDKVIAALLDHKNPDLKKVGNRLKQKKHKRVLADYRLDEQVSYRDANDHLKKTINDIQFIESIITQLPSN